MVANPRVLQPAWSEGEAAIRVLDGWARPAVTVWTTAADRPVGLEVRGGAGGYALREVPEGWVYRDPTHGN